ncbi:NAD-dependent deacetylase SIRT1 [Aphelenchoides avenae]|nr:NAD-dependent deacetylase SIRT1 [Aphelenchus avenae]
MEQAKQAESLVVTSVESVVTKVSSTGTSTVSSTEESKEVWRLELEEPLAHKWKRPNEDMLMVQRLLEEGLTPIEVLKQLLPHTPLPADLTNTLAMRFIIGLINDSNRSREKLTQFNTFHDAVQLVRKSKRILVLTGAGVSVSCGIPDFRSKNGIYARLKTDFPDLPDPTAMFDIDFFRKNPKPFFNFAKEIFPGQFVPSLSHMFIKHLEDSGQLLRNYTQNIDTLEKIAGINRVLECHGSFAKATCLSCDTEIDCSDIQDDVMKKRVAHCKVCLTGVVKPNIVFFGEDLGDRFHIQMGEDRDLVDLLIVVGSSLKVQPVALIPFNLDPSVPQILINREQLPHYQADITLLGNCDDILVALSIAVGGDLKDKMQAEIHKRNVKIPQADIRQLSVDDFKKLIDEPDSKRSRVDDSAEESSSLWEGNYVLVESRLPNNSYLLVPPNVNVFKGAEMYYDRDQDTFCRQAGSREAPAFDSDDDSESSSGSSSDSNCSSDRGGSLPPVPTTVVDEQPKRAASCPPPDTENDLTDEADLRK